MRQVFRGPVDSVAARDTHVHNYWPESQPPDDPAMSLQCWQCRRLTWRFTPRCVHCRVSLSPLKRGWLRLVDRVVRVCARHGA